MRVLISPDKFKGSLTAAEVADHLATGLAEAGVQTDTLPLADGGDGSVDAAVRAGFVARHVEVVNAVGRPHRARIAERNGTTVIEVANTCGLQSLPDGVLAPTTASSYGLGEVIRCALEREPASLVLGLGGSASTDGGIGMLAALGYRFLDVDGAVVPPVASRLSQIRGVEPAQTVRFGQTSLIIASDVTNPLVGPTGAAAVFGPQKGATAAQVAELDTGLQALVKAFGESGFVDAQAMAARPGAGAAGGTGFAAMILGGTVVSGADYFLDLLDFDGRCQEVDAVITGEGRLDRQSLDGKLPVAVARRASPKNVYAVVGTSELAPADTPFADIFSVAGIAGTDTSRDRGRTTDLLEHIGRVVGRRLRTSSA
ncbi:glycerate kinase [Mycobacterium sp. NPDC003323]